VTLNGRPLSLKRDRVFVEQRSVDVDALVLHALRTPREGCQTILYEDRLALPHCDRALPRCDVALQPDDVALPRDDVALQPDDAALQPDDAALPRCDVALQAVNGALQAVNGGLQAVNGALQAVNGALQADRWPLSFEPARRPSPLPGVTSAPAPRACSACAHKMEGSGRFVAARRGISDRRQTVG
jgi:hypothetical protein